MNFGEAIEHLKKSPDNKVTRSNWYGSLAKPVVRLQTPDSNSKMSLPYLYMEKYTVTQSGAIGEKLIRFPLDLSCESVLSEEWEIV